MSIDASTPTTLDATYDKWATVVQQYGDGCADYGASAAGPIAVGCTLVKYRDRTDGVAERSPLPTDRVTLRIDDLYTYLATDTPHSQALAQAVQAMTAALVAIAADQGKI